MKFSITETPGLDDENVRDHSMIGVWSFVAWRCSTSILNLTYHVVSAGIANDLGIVSSPVRGNTEIEQVFGQTSFDDFYVIWPF